MKCAAPNKYHTLCGPLNYSKNILDLGTCHLANFMASPKVNNTLVALDPTFNNITFLNSGAHLCDPNPNLNNVKICRGPRMHLCDVVQDVF